MLREYIRRLLEQEEQEEQEKKPDFDLMWSAYEKYKTKYHWPENLTRDDLAVLRSIATAEMYSPVLGITNRGTYRKLVEEEGLAHTAGPNGTMALTGRGHELFVRIVQSIQLYQAEEHYEKYKQYIEPGEEQ